MTPFNKILAEVDPRAAAQPALARLRQLTRGGDARIDLVTCDCMDAPDVPVADADLEAAQADYAARLERWLDEQAAALGDREVWTQVVWHAPRYEAILDRAKAAGADLVMRSARHHSRLERLLIGATDWELVRHAPQTVWLVKREPVDEDRGLRVLAAVDPVHARERQVGLDRRVVDTAARIAAPDGGELHLFHAWQPGIAMAPAIAAGPHVPLPLINMDPETIDRLRGERQSRLDELAGRAGLPSSRTHLVEGAVTDALDELVRELDVDVIVAGGVARGRLERLVIGSTAEAILEHADCDVVVVKPPSDSKEETNR